MRYNGVAALFRSPLTLWKSGDAKYLNIEAEYSTSANAGEAGFIRFGEKKILNTVPYAIKNGKAIYKIDLSKGCRINKSRKYKRHFDLLIEYNLLPI